MADITIYNPLLMSLVSQSGVPFLAVEFRPAPEVSKSIPLSLRSWNAPRELKREASTADRPWPKTASPA
jgi:hypothetical protein